MPAYLERDPHPHAFRPRDWLPAIILLAGAGLLAWRWSAARPLWLDEEMIALNLRGRTLRELAGPLWLAQAAPLGWLILERCALVALGTGERVLRLPSLAFGLGTLVCAYWAGRRWLGVAGATVLALLCASGPWLAYHALELKPYASDAFWAFLLPLMAVWALEDRAPRRVPAWWLVAALAQWFSNAALLVVPACALVLHGTLWRRHGWRVSALGAATAVVWLASFALHYALSGRYTLGSAALRDYWTFAMAPAGGGAAAFGHWVANTLRALAIKPGGATSGGLLFWIPVAVGCGLAIAARPPAGLLLTLIPVSALALAAFRLVPAHERLSLWIVPALYTSLAVAADGAARCGWRAIRQRRLVAAALALAVLAAVAPLTVTIIGNSRPMLWQRPTDDAHDLDDRRAVRWMMKQYRPGDAVLTTGLALPAVWWYGGTEWTPAQSDRGSKDGAVPVFEAQIVSGLGACAPALVEQLGRPRRVLLYLGFRVDDWPDPRERLLLARLAELGPITQFRGFARFGAVVVVDREQPRVGVEQLPRPWAPGVETKPAAGCIAARPARAW